eukprot:141700_1
MSSYCRTLSKVFRLWKSLFKQAWPILIISCIIGSVYTILERGNQRSDGTLSICWWFTGEITAWIGFGVVVIAPYTICGWISFNWSISLLAICLITDLTFRIGYWKMEHIHYYSTTIISDQIYHLYLGVWALFNDLNSWIWVPLLVYLLQYTNNNKKNKKNHSKNIELTDKLLTPSSSLINENKTVSKNSNKIQMMKSKLNFNKDLDEIIWTEINNVNSNSFDDTHKQSLLPRTQTIVSSVMSTNLKAETCFSKERKISKLLKYSIIFCIIWFLCQDVYEYYSRDRNIYPRFLPLILVLIGLICDLQWSFKQNKIFFHSFWYMLGYILVQNLFTTWATLTIDIVAFASNGFQLTSNNWIENAIARMIIFFAYSFSFQLIMFIGRKFAIHSKQPNNKKNKVQWDNFNSFDLQFIFMIYSDYFLFQFITLTSFNLTYFATLIAKELWTVIKLHPTLRMKSKIFSNNPLQAWFAYVYGILISWIVLTCQLCVIYADYFQPFENDKQYWLFGNNNKNKTTENLLLATFMIFITLVCDMMVYLFIFKAQRMNLQKFTEKVKEIKERYNDLNKSNDVSNEYFMDEFNIDNIRIKTICNDDMNDRNITVIDMSDNEDNMFENKSRMNSMLITLDNDDEYDDYKEFYENKQETVHIERGATIRKNTHTIATGLGLYIPFHLWYYTFVSSLVAIRCTEIIFTKLYDYFI